MNQGKLKIVQVFLIGWFLLYAILSFYPWFSEGMFWNFVQHVDIGQQAEVITKEISKYRVFRFEKEPLPQIGLSTNCVLCLGTVDPPRRLYLLITDSKIVSKSLEVADFRAESDLSSDERLKKFKWYRSYGKFLFRSFVCCAVVYLAFLVFLRQRSRIVRGLAIIFSGICLLAIFFDVAWLLLVYLRYAILFYRC